MPVLNSPSPDMAINTADSNRQLGEDLGPCFELFVEGTKLQDDIKRHVYKVEWESAMDMADALKIHVSNPGGVLTYDEDADDYTSHKVFQPGNEVELRMGYGNKAEFMCRSIISKHLPNYPEDGIPTLEIHGYDKSQLLMNAAGSKAKSGKSNIVKGTSRGGLTESMLGGGPNHVREATDRDQQGTLYVNMRASDIAKRIAAKYGMEVDVDETDRLLKNATGEGIVQKKGLTDYQMMSMLANISQCEFFVDYVPPTISFNPLEGLNFKTYEHPGAGWTLHFKKSAERNQPGYIFVYGAGNKTTLLSYSAEYGLRDNITELTVSGWHDGRWVSMVLIEGLEGPDPRFRQGGGAMDRTKSVVQEDPTAKPKTTKAKTKILNQAGEANQLIKNALRSATQFKLAATGVAIDVQHRPFSSLEELAEFAYRWFKARKDNFIIGKGKLVGLETLRARQVHRFDGVGPLSGLYYFINVNHVMDADGGYSCEYTARKVID